MECECGKDVIMKIANKKVVVVRDYLQREGFRCNENNAKEGKNTEFLLQCNNCKKWIILDMN